MESPKPSKKARQEDQQGEEGLREEGRKVRYRASSEEKEDPRRRQREGNIFSPEPPEESLWPYGLIPVKLIFTHLTFRTMRE